MADRDLLPENWAELDSAHSYFEAVREIGRRVKAGAIELPEMFRERGSQIERNWNERICIL